MPKKTFRIKSTHPAEAILNEKRIDLNFLCSYEQLDENTIPLIVIGGFSEYSNSAYMNSLYETFKDKNIFFMGIDSIGTYVYNIFSEETLLGNKYLDNVKKDVYITDEQIDFLFDNLIEIKSDPKGMEAVLKQAGYLKSDASLVDNMDLIKELIIYIRQPDISINKLFIVFQRLGFIKSLTDVSLRITGDYQDFGLIQAIDILTAVKFLKKEYPTIDWKRLSIVGSSHGAYIAQMVSKIAPNSIAKVVANSSWVRPPSVEITNIKRVHFGINGVQSNCILAKGWSFDKKDKNYLDEEKVLIRDIGAQVDQQKKQTKKKNMPQYVLSHAINDHLIPIEEKDAVVEAFVKNGFDVKYIRLDSEDKLDGRLFKTLEHGAKVSIKGLIHEYILKDEIKPINKDDFELESKIKYKGKKGKYIINFFSNENYPEVTYKKKK
jgi:predicted esterase